MAGPILQSLRMLLLMRPATLQRNAMQVIAGLSDLLTLHTDNIQVEIRGFTRLSDTDSGLASDSSEAKELRYLETTYGEKSEARLANVASQSHSSIARYTQSFSCLRNS